MTHAGMRPVNNVVDVTNYVMWAVGQPLHAFDLETVRGRRIIVRRARPGEPITTLDGTPRTLTDEMLVIADAESASVIAGVMGSADSEVTDETTNILLEAANFNGPSIMRTSSALGLRSEASTRFEKGLDPNLVPLALDMACRMLVELCGGAVSRGTVDVLAGDGRSPGRCGSVRRAWRPILGEAVPVGEIKDDPGAAGLRRRAATSASQRREPLRLVVTVPTFRRDLEREIDLIEEVARIFGLDRLPATMPARRGRGRPDADPAPAARRRRRAAGCRALPRRITFSFVDPTWMDRLATRPDDDRPAPVAADQSAERRPVGHAHHAPARVSWRPPQRNRSVREERVHLFEVGKIFHASADSGRPWPPPAGGRPRSCPESCRRSACCCSGDWVEESWAAGRRPHRLLPGQGPGGARPRRPGCRGDVRAGGRAVPAPGQERRGGVRRRRSWAGWARCTRWCSAFDLPAGAVAAELDLDLLLAAVEAVPLFEDLLTFPAVEQDLALVVDSGRDRADVVGAVRAAGGPLLRDVRVFDVYEGRQVGEGKKSLALRLRLPLRGTHPERGRGQRRARGPAGRAARRAGGRAARVDPRFAPMPRPAGPVVQAAAGFCLPTHSVYSYALCAGEARDGEGERHDEGEHRGGDRVHRGRC